MHIAMVCYPTAGGSGVIATELALALVDRGHTVHIVANDRPLRMREDHGDLHFHEIKIPSYDLFPDASYGMSGACKLMEVLGREQIDLIHAHYAFPHALSAHLALDMADRPEIQIVTTLHGSDIYLAEEHVCHYSVVESSLKRSKRITAVSEFLRDETHRIFSGDLNVSVIPNFVDTKVFSPDRPGEKQPVDIPEDSCVLVHVSNYRPIKRSDDMVRLLRAMLERGQRTHLLMIGDGPERERVESMVSEFHLREHVTWVDPVREVNRWLTLGDFLVVASERESFSMAALEGMASGLPVLNLAEGGVRELVRNGVDGIHVNERDLSELSERAVELYRDVERMKTMRLSVRERVINHFSKENVVDQYVSLYREVFEAAGASSD